jgi:competence protein ComEC
VRVLDVGQGTAVLLRTADRHAALFDAGPADCHLGAQLRSLGVKRLDLVVISHPHADHFAGLADALDAVEVGSFTDRVQIARLESDVASEAAGGAEARQYLELRALLAERGCHTALAVSGASFPFHGVAIKLWVPAKPLVLEETLNPWGSGRSPPSGDELNAGSVVVMLELDGSRFLLPGDAEADTLEQYRLPDTDVLVVGHHGSRGAVSTALLQRLRPGLAVISVGEGNTYGHPDAETLATLRASGNTVLRTDRSGWVSLRTKDGAMAVFTERTEPP